MLSSHADDFRNESWQMFLQHRGVGAGTVDERKFGLLGCVRLLLTRLLLFTSAHSLSSPGFSPFPLPTLCGVLGIYLEVLALRRL